eukprot:Gb_26811 [translate_table: standard]
MDTSMVYDSSKNTNGIVYGPKVLLHRSDLKTKWRKKLECIDCLLRILVFCTSMVATVVMLTDKQTVDVGGIFHMKAIYYYAASLTYTMVASSVTCFYSVISLLVTSLALKKARFPRRTRWCLFVSDLMVMSVLLSSVSAAADLAYIAYKGNSHVLWKSVCHTIDDFCEQAVAAATTSMLAVVILLMLILLSARVLTLDAIDL